MSEIQPAKLSIKRLKRILQVSDITEWLYPLKETRFYEWRSEISGSHGTIGYLVKKDGSVEVLDHGYTFVTNGGRVLSDTKPVYLLEALAQTNVEEGDAVAIYDFCNRIDRDNYHEWYYIKVTKQLVDILNQFRQKLEEKENETWWSEKMTEIKVKANTYSVDGHKIGEKEITIKLVADEPCPVCGWTTPNRPKVYDEHGWWWRCYNPDCPVVYYNPSKKLLNIKPPTSAKTKTLRYEEVNPP